MNAESRSLPAADLSEAFGKSPRSAGLRLPPGKKAAQTPPEPAERPMSAVPDPAEAAGDDDASQGGLGVSAAPAGPEPAVDADVQNDTPARPDSQAGAARSGAAPEGPETRATRPNRSGRPTRSRVATATQPAPPARPAAGQAKLVLWTPMSIRARMQVVQAQRGTLYLDQVLDALESTVDQLPELIAQQNSTPHVQGKLFERARPSAESREQRVQLTIRGVLNSHLEVIDQLVATSGAPSRSALVNAALDASLPQL